MSDQRKRKWIAIGLIAFGVLLLMVSNRILVGWEHVWPLFLVGAGAIFLRGFRSRRDAWMLGTGVAATMLGVFLLLFSAGILDWPRMDTLWPIFPLVAGVSLLAAAAIHPHGAVLLIAGSVLILLTAMSFLIETSVIDRRVAEPFIRFWPLALILAGVVLMKTRPRAGSRPDPDMKAVREVLEQAGDENIGDERVIPPGVADTIVDRVRAAGDPDAAVAELVGGLKANFPRFSWVGVYRLSGGLLTLGETDYVGATPEHQRIPMGEGICGAAASADETVVVPDVRNDPRYLACSPSVRSEIVVPIRAEGTILGVLDIDSDSPDAFSDADRRFLESLVARAAPHLRVGLPSA